MVQGLRKNRGKKTAGRRRDDCAPRGDASLAALATLLALFQARLPPQRPGSAPAAPPGDRVATGARRLHARAQAGVHVLLALRELDYGRVLATVHPTERAAFARATGTEKAAQVGGLTCFGLVGLTGPRDVPE